jgi:hypothetical protein
MANEYMQSNVTGAGLVPPHKTRSKATDKSSVGSDFGGGVAPAGVNYAAPHTGKTSTGPSQLIQGIYTQPAGGRKI